MIKIIGLVNDCKGCPNRHYYSGGVYECLPLQRQLDPAVTIPGWCPLSDYPAAPVADSALSDVMLEKLYWSAMDNAADILSFMDEARALAASEPKNTGE